MALIDSITHTRHYPAKVLSVSLVAHNTYEVSFEIQGVEEFSFAPGQYVWVDVPKLLKDDPRGSRRAYSISSPQGGNKIVILFRGTKSGHKEALVQSKPGDSVMVIGPFGSAFVLPEDVSVPVVLIGGGVGISPFLSVLRSTLAEGSERHLSFLFAFTSKETAPYLPELKKLSRGIEGAGVVQFGHVEDSDIEPLIVPKALYYVSGPQEFVTAVDRILRQKKVDPQRICFEEVRPEVEGELHFQEMVRQFIKDTSSEDVLTPQNALRAVVESTPHHMVVTDERGVIVFANKATSQITGFSLGEMIGNTPRLWGGYMPASFYKKIWALGPKDPPFSGEIVNRRKNGELYTAIFRIMGLFDKQGRRIGFVASEEDITDRVEAERHERAQKIFLETVLDTVPSPVFVKNVDTGRFLFANKEAEKFVGHTSEEIVGKKEADILPRQKNDTHEEDDREVVLLGAIKESVPQPILRSDGTERIVAVKRASFSGASPDERLVLCVVQDVTDAVLREKEKTRQLQELEKMNALMVGRELKMIELKETIKKLNGKRKN